MHVRSEEKLRNQTVIYLGKLQYPIWELVLTQDVPFQNLTNFANWNKKKFFLKITNDE